MVCARVMAGLKPLGVFHLTIFKYYFLTYFFKLRGIDTDYFKCELPKLASSFPEKILAFCVRFLVDPAPQFSNILIQILSDMLYLLCNLLCLPYISYNKTGISRAACVM